MVEYLKNLHRVNIPKYIGDYQTPAETDWDEILVWFAAKRLTVFRGQPYALDQYVIVYENMWYCCYFSEASTAFQFKLKFLTYSPPDNPKARLPYQ